MKTIAAVTAAFALAVVVPGLASASPMLQARAFDGSTPIALTTAINSSGTLLEFGSDANFASVTINGSGVPNNPGLALTTLDVVASTASTLTIVLTQVGLTATTALIPFAATFTANALVASAPVTFAYTDYISKTNVAFDTSAADALLPTDTMANVTGSQSASGTGTVGGFTLGSPFSETQVIKITFTGATNGSISASSQLIPVPEPMSIALFGSALVAFGAVRRRNA